MTTVVDDTALVFAACAALAVVLITFRRMFVDTTERSRRADSELIRPLALALIAGEDGADAAASKLRRRGRRALTGSLGLYAGQLTGPDLARISALLEQSGEVGDEIKALRRSLRGWRRAQAAYVLGDVGSSLAVPHLLAALQGDRDRDVRACAARSLGRLRSPEATEPLVHALAEHTVPRAVAGRALVSIGAAALPSLKPLAGSTQPALRTTAAQLIGLLGNSGATDSLLPLLRDTVPATRAAAAGALGRIGARPATSKLRERLSDPEPAVRAAAARALGQIGDPEAVPDLLLTAREPGFEPAREAADAVARLDPQALAPVEGDGNRHLQEARDRVRLGLMRPRRGVA
jgi:hypothetical protein